VSPHYIVEVTQDSVLICDECDELYAEFGPLK